jgi:hypothetical protein
MEQVKQIEEVYKMNEFCSRDLAASLEKFEEMTSQLCVKQQARLLFQKTPSHIQNLIEAITAGPIRSWSELKRQINMAHSRHLLDELNIGVYAEGDARDFATYLKAYSDATTGLMFEFRCQRLQDYLTDPVLQERWSYVWTTLRATERFTWTTFMDAMINLEKQCPGYYDSVSNIAPFHPKLETHVPVPTAAPQAISKAHDNRVSRLSDPKRINRPPTPVVNQEKPIFLEPIREVAESEKRDPRITQFNYVKAKKCRRPSTVPGSVCPCLGHAPGEDCACQCYCYCICGRNDFECILGTFCSECDAYAALNREGMILFDPNADMIVTSNFNLTDAGKTQSTSAAMQVRESDPQLKKGETITSSKTRTCNVTAQGRRNNVLVTEKPKSTTVSSGSSQQKSSTSESKRDGTELFA